MKQTIIIKGGAYEKIKRVLRQWLRLYRNDLDPSLTFDLKRISKGNHLITINEQIKNDLFFYLINYLEYPEEINYSIEVKGYTIGDKNSCLDKILQVFINKNDKEFDNVYIVTEHNETFKFDFSGSITEQNLIKSFEPIKEYPTLPTEIIHIPNITVNKEEHQLKKITKRFKVISLIWFAGLLVNFILPIFQPDIAIIYAISFGMILGHWFLLDYKMLRLTKFYFYSSGICALTFLFGNLLELVHPLLYKNHEGTFLYSFGLTIIIIQQPLRHLFLFLFKREPKVERNEGFLNTLYSISLGIPMVILPFILLDILNK